MQLSNWNPFKFTRKKAEEKAEETTKPSEGKMAKAEQAAPAMIPTEWFRSFFGPSWMETWLRNDPFSMLGGLDRWFGDFSPATFRPSIDVTDEGKALRITAELPGLDEKEVTISVEDDALTISGEKKMESKTEKADCYRVERAYGSFRRVLPLPSDVDRDKIEAKMDKGVLTVLVPKLEGAKPKEKTIPIKTN